MRKDGMLSLEGNIESSHSAATSLHFLDYSFFSLFIVFVMDWCLLFGQYRCFVLLTGLYKT